jgi:predicted component of type VI protein secretion system
MPKLVYHDSDGVDKALNLGAEPVLIGRATECQIQTQDAMVSRRHARIVWDGNYWIEDLGSSNGVYVGHEKVQRAPFRPGDTVTCGSLVLRLLPDASPRASSQSDVPAEPPVKRVAATLMPDALIQPPAEPTIPRPEPPRVDPPRLDARPEPPRADRPEPPKADIQPEATSTEPPEPTPVRPERQRSITAPQHGGPLSGPRVIPPSSPVDLAPSQAAPAGSPRTDPKVADAMILLGDSLASLRASLRNANGEATLLKEPEEATQGVREALKAAAEELETARGQLRSLAKLLGL